MKETPGVCSRTMTLGKLADSGQCGRWHPRRAVNYSKSKFARLRNAWGLPLDSPVTTIGRFKLLPDFIYTDGGLLRKRSGCETITVGGVKFFVTAYCSAHATVLLTLPQIMPSTKMANWPVLLTSCPPLLKSARLDSQNLPPGFCERLESFSRLM